MWKQTGTGSRRVPDPVGERPEMGSGTGTTWSQTPFPQPTDDSNGATYLSFLRPSIGTVLELAWLGLSGFS